MPVPYEWLLRQHPNFIYTYCGLPPVVILFPGSEWHSGRICRYFCLDDEVDQDRRHIAIYLTISYAGQQCQPSTCLSSCQSISLHLIIIGFPFLVMGVCYGLIYYKVIILLHFPPPILTCSSPSSDACFQTQFGGQGCNCFQPSEEAQKLYQNVVFHTVQVSSHCIWWRGVCKTKSLL